MKREQLDITKEHCPMTFVKAKIALSKLNTGDQLEVFLLDGEPMENVPKSAQEQGHKIIEKSHIEGNTYRVVIEK